MWAPRWGVSEALRAIPERNPLSGKYDKPDRERPPVSPQAAPGVPEPSRVFRLRDWKKFENAVAALLNSLLSTFRGGKVDFPVGPPPIQAARGRRRRQPVRKLDWAAWKNIAYDAQHLQHSIFVNVEATVKDLRQDVDYLADKVDALRQILDTNGGSMMAAVRAVRAAHPETDELTSEPDPFLLPLS